MDATFPILLIVAICTAGARTAILEDADFWMKAGENQLKDMLGRHKEHQHAKNIIIFVGDGMGLSTVTSARIYKGQKNKQSGESGFLSFEKFPNTGLSKTYAVNKQVTDSAASATALFTGVKTNYLLLGLDAQATFNVCDSSINNKSAVSSIMDWAQKSGKDTGFVTTTRVTHATPAGLYAHTNSRYWECEEKIPQQYRRCVDDIALQLVKNEPGKNFKVILGGGGRQLGVNTSGPLYDGCGRTDGRNLAKEWLKNKTNAAVVTTKSELKHVDVKKTEYLLGLFGPDHIGYAGERQTGLYGQQPTLFDMTVEAINILMKNPKGFVLMVEGGRIDHAHHENLARLALEETLEFEEAIAAAAILTDVKDTLIIVTADHSHSFTMNGYPERGNDILGVNTEDNVTYETLSYANGPGFTYHKLNSSDPKMWMDLKNSTEERKKLFYRHFSPIYMGSETHGGEDVGVYTRGPSSNLFTGVYDHNYIAHAISYAACIGPHAHMCSASTLIYGHSIFILLALAQCSVY